MDKAMSRRSKKLFIIFIVLTLLVFGGCAAEEPLEDTSEQEVVKDNIEEVDTSTVEEEKKAAVRYPIKIEDVDGREIIISEEVDGIIPLLSSAARAVSILGKDDLIVGMSDHLAREKVFFPELADRPAIGSWQSPDIEKITMIASNYNNVVIIARGGPSAIELQEKLAGTGITVVSLNLGDTDFVFSGLLSLGYILDAEERAKEYISFVEEILDPIQEFVRGIPEDERSSVLLLHGRGPDPRGAKTAAEVTGWGAVGYGGPAYSLVLMAGGKPITADLPSHSVVSLEWIMTENPDKVVGWTPFDSGYSTNDMSALKHRHYLFKNAPGASEITAVVNSDVSIIAFDIALSPHFIVALVALVEKWYPDEFDFSHEEIHQEIIDRFHSLDFDVKKQGAFIYQGEN